MKEEKDKLTVRDFVDAADVRGQFLYRKDGYILTYLRVYPYNLELKSHEERKAETDSLAATFKDDRKDFTYFSLPREVDMDRYKISLKEKYGQEMNIGKRHILNRMMEQCAALIMGGENYEHQHFIKIWQPATQANRNRVEEALAERMHEFEVRYKSVGIHCEVLCEAEIVKLCNLFGNSLHASSEIVEQATLFSPIMQM